MDKNIIENKPDFSVIMANYNNGKYIKEAIESVINQTYKNWELLIIDDYSLDNSVEIIQQYLADPRIKLLRHKMNLGYIETLKKLINKSNSEIVGILDSDDALKKNAVEVILGTYKKHSDCGFMYSQFLYCNTSLKPLRKGGCQKIPKNRTNLDINYVSHFKTFKKKYYFKTGGYDNTILYAEDKDLIFKMEEVTKLYFVDKVLYCYRVLPTSQSNDLKKQKIGYSSHILAKYNAFLRRYRTKFNNLTKKQIKDDLIKGIKINIKLYRIKPIIIFILRYIKLLFL